MKPRTLTTMALVGAVVLVVDVPRAYADWTVAGFVGAAHTQDSSIRLTQPADSNDVTLSPVSYRSESFELPIYYGYRVGLFPHSRWLGVEGEFIHLKVIADTSRPPVAGVLERFSITHGVNLVLVNAVVRHALGDDNHPWPRWLVTGRLGAGTSVPHAESTIGGVSQEQYEWGSFSAQAAAGVELRLGQRVSLAGEYKLTRTVQDVSVVRGSVNTSLTTHHLVTGLVVHLGGAANQHKATL